MLISPKLSRVVLILFALQFFPTCNVSSGKSGTQDSLKTVTVDNVYAAPAKYFNPVRMTGKIVAIDTAQATLFFGCDDECMRLPVHYTGILPAIGKSAIAVGKVVIVDGKFVFEAQQVLEK